MPLCGALAFGALYVLVVRPRAARWGATDEEATRRMPGDGVVPGRAYVATRAITIDALPEDVWPWIVQMGSGRGGWYALDRLDNGGVPSADQVIPQLQDLQVGDLIPMVPGKDIGPRVLEMERERRLMIEDGAPGSIRRFPGTGTHGPPAESESAELLDMRISDLQRTIGVNGFRARRLLGTFGSYRGGLRLGTFRHRNL